MSYQSNLPVPLNPFAAQQAQLESLGRDALIVPASLPVPNSTHSYWLHPRHVNPLAKEGSDGPLTTDADICIVGSGITGISAAYHIAKSARTLLGDQALNVVILEARDFCSGATGKLLLNGGHLSPHAFIGFERLSNEIGIEEALKQIAIEHHTVDDLAQFVKENSLVHTVDLVDGGRIDLFFTGKEVEGAKADFAGAKEAGARLDSVKWISKDEMQKTYGTSYEAVRTPSYNVWPMKLVTQLFLHAKKTATNVTLNLHTSTPVTSITPVPSASSAENNTFPRRWSLHTPRGNISCHTVLHATNGYASHLLPHFAGPAGIVPTRGQIIATRASVPIEGPGGLGWSSWTGNERFEYWFPRPLGAGAGPHLDCKATTNVQLQQPEQDKSPKEQFPIVVLGGGREIKPNFELDTTDDSVLNEEVSAVLHNFLPAVFPGKFEEGREPEMEWTGIMGFTRIGDPFVGPVLDPSDPASEKFRGQYISAGYSGHGMPRGYACAEVAVQLILHDLQGKPRETWSPPDWLPRRYLTWERYAS